MLKLFQDQEIQGLKLMHPPRFKHPSILDKAVLLGMAASSAAVLKVVQT